MSKWKELNTISKEYEEQRHILRSKLRAEEDYFDTLTKEDENYKAVEQRVKLLRSMERDLREISRESKHYYEKGWWRSECYTHNSRKPRECSFAPIHETDSTCE